MLYTTLLEIVKGLNTAMGGNDIDAFDQLFEKYRITMGEIKKAGISHAPGLFNIITEIMGQIDKVVIETKEKQNHVLSQLKAIGNKQKFNSAYR